MNAPSRRAFLGFGSKAVAAVAIGGLAVRLIDTAEALPVDSGLGTAGHASDLVTQAQWWGPPPGPGWGGPPPRRRRRWVCWWRRGRRHCGWRW
jgi:hypothetical protein